MRKKIHFYMSCVALTVAPLTSFAAAWCVGTDCSFRRFVDWSIGSLFRPIVPVLVSLTVAYFLWGTADYIRFADSADKRSEGRKRMFWGIVGLAVIMGFWAAARMVKNTFFG